MIPRPEFLTAEEERGLAVRAQSGDMDARDRLIASQTRFVHKIARRFATASMPEEDLAQEGMIGMMKAVEKFDPHKGYRLSTYASDWVVARITRAIRAKASLIKLPDYLQVQSDGMWKGEPIPRLPRVFTDADNAIVCRSEEVARSADTESYFDWIHPEAVDPYDHVTEANDKDELQHNMHRLNVAMGHLTVEQKKWLRLEYGLEGSRAMNHKQQRLLLHRGDDTLLEIRETTMRKLRKAMGA